MNAKPSIFLAALFAWPVLHAAPAGSGKPPVQDFTNGGQRDSTHDWTLGPTGLRGWVWSWKGQTTDARQILVTEVAPGSPAEGRLHAGDVILGIDGKPFANDARRVFAESITRAEAADGKLALLCWNKEGTRKVEIRIPAIGAYSSTAPYDCPKSKRIFEQGCTAIVRNGFRNPRGAVEVSIPNDLKALALVAGGNPDHLPAAAEYARVVANHTPGGHKSWGYAYETLFLAEYALATGDASVKPGLKRLATDIAKGQSAVGTWGHGFAREEGNLNGYGCMNQPGIVLTLAMQAAREAGVKSADLDAAIARSARFLRWYVDKGAVPYGDHAPWPDHDDNGKCSSAALMFDGLGERHAAAFFSRMATAAYAERESGHTGNFFNVLWALPGVSRSGPLATGAYMKETAWYYDLARGWDGSFRHQGIPGERESYQGWDSTGAYLLAYALPLKKTLITGRKPAVVPPLTRDEVAETIRDGRWSWWSGQQDLYDVLTTGVLMEKLSSWSPAVRLRAAKALAAKPDAAVDALARMLASEKRESRYGACVALKFLGTKADPAAGELRKLLSSPDPWLRALAAEAIAETSPAVREAAVPDLLRALVRKDDAGDPRRCVMGPLTEVLFKPAPGRRDPDPILSRSFDPVAEADRPLLVRAIRDVLHSEDGRIRGGVSRIYPFLNPAELALLMPDIVETVRTPAPSGEMFANDIRLSGLELLQSLRIREGMGYCVDYMTGLGWGRDRMLPVCFKVLSGYGGNARPFLPRLKEYRETLAAEDRGKKEKDGPLAKNIEALDQLIVRIGQDSAPVALRSVEEFVASPRRPE